MLERLKKNSERVINLITYITSLEFKQKLTIKSNDKVRSNAADKISRNQTNLYYAAQNDISAANKRSSNNLKLIEQLAERNADNADEAAKASKIAAQAFDS